MNYRAHNHTNRPKKCIQQFKIEHKNKVNIQKRALKYKV